MTSNPEQELPAGIQALRRAKGLSIVGNPKVHPRTPDAIQPVQSGEAPQVQQPTSNPNTTPQETVDWEKRYSDLRRREQQLQEEVNELKGKVVNTTKETLLPKSDVELESWKKEHPELYDAVVTVYRKETEQLTSEMEAAKAELDRIKLANQKEAVFNEVLKEHRDADTIRRSNEFKTWYSNQSPGVQTLVDSLDARDIIKGLHLYKVDMGITSTNKQSEVNPYKSVDAASAVGVQSQTSLPQQPKVWSQQEINALSPAEYAKHRAEIMAQRMRSN